MAFYDVQTILFVIGCLYVLLPITAWMVLSSQRSKAASLWCSGGLIFSLSFFFVSLRGNAPDWLTHSVTNYLFWIANILPIMALREQLQRPQRIRTVLAGLLAAIAVFEYLNLVAESQTLRFLWSLSIAGWLFGYIHRLSLEVAKTQQIRSAHWLATVYFVAASIVCLRCLRVILGFAPSIVTVGGYDNLITLFAGVLTSALGNFAFVGTYLERASKQSTQAAVERAKQEEAARLGAQIAHLDRQRALGTMSAAFAHELSQPLTAILMDTQNAKTVLMTESNQPSELVQTLQDIQTSSERAVDLLQRIRNFIKPTQTRHTRIELQPLIREVVQLMQSHGKAAEVQLQLDLGDTPAWVWGDRIELSQIMVNVVRNAIEAMQNSLTRCVTLRLTSTDQRCLLEFTDTGPGITHELQAPIGTPFVTTKPEGLGVGFSISRAIAEKHGGSLTIANVPSGGACVTLDLPRIKESAC